MVGVSSVNKLARFEVSSTIGSTTMLQIQKPRTLIECAEITGKTGAAAPAGSSALWPLLRRRPATG